MNDNTDKTRLNGHLLSISIMCMKWIKVFKIYKSR